MSDQDATRQAGKAVRRSGEAVGASDGDSDPGAFTPQRPPPLDFQAWCEVAASLLDRDPVQRFGILAERDLEPVLWHRCDHYWTMVVARDVAGGGSERVDAYASRCAAEMAARRAGARSVRRWPLGGEGAREAVSPLPGAGVDETSWLAAPPADPALPFERGREDSAPQRVLLPTDQRLDLAGETALATPVVEALDETLPFVLPAEDDLARSDVAPEPPAGSAERGGDPLEHYAALCAKLALFPDQAQHIGARYGYPTEAELAGLRERWQQRFDAEPTLQARFEQLEQQYRNHLVGRPPDG